MYGTTLKRPMRVKFHFIQLNSTPRVWHKDNYSFFTPGVKVKFCGFCCELVDMALATYTQNKWFQQQFSGTYPWRKLDIGTKNKPNNNEEPMQPGIYCT